LGESAHVGSVKTIALRDDSMPFRKYCTYLCMKSLQLAL
jgi:hypothetical protein